MSADQAPTPPRPYSGRVVAIDLADSFYLFKFDRHAPELVELLSLELPFTCSDLGIDGVPDEDGWHDLQPSSKVFG